MALTPAPWTVTMDELTQQDFERLLAVRVILRQFRRWSEDRAEAAGLGERTPDPQDRRAVQVRLTAGSEQVLHKLTRAHLDRPHELVAVLDDFVTAHDEATAVQP